MMTGDRQILRLAVPSELPGGLDSGRSGRFGRSPCFTMVDVVDDMVVNAFVVLNVERRKGDHHLPQVLLLGEHAVDVLIVAGIGHGPLLACVQAGMRVLAGEDRDTVRAVIDAFMDADLEPVGRDSTDVH
jgi:predicted Fe-Mo cluster-binding NifX family protein